MNVVATNPASTLAPPAESSLRDKIAIRHLNFFYGETRALKDISLPLYENRVTAFIGPSGCGKSTLLHLLGGLDEPDRGSISLNGAPLRLNRSSLRLLRHQVGFVFQLHNLIPDLTLEENCLIPTVAV